MGAWFVEKSNRLRVRRHEVLCLLHHEVAVWPAACHLTFLGVSFFIYKGRGLDSSISKTTYSFYSPWSIIRSGLFSSTCLLFLCWPREQHSNKQKPTEISHKTASACDSYFHFPYWYWVCVNDFQGLYIWKLRLRSDLGNLVMRFSNKWLRGTCEIFFFIGVVIRVKVSISGRRN